MKTAVVILNWNGSELLERFLPDVIRYSKDVAQVYVADNASTDDSVALCQSRFRESITLIQNEVNGGYAKGYNDALRHVEADLFVLLNSDVAVTKNWLTPIINAFKEEETLAAAQPKIKDLKAPTQFEYAGAAGGFLDSFGYPFCRGRIFENCEEDQGQYDNTLEIQWASGACLFIRSKVFWEMEGLDEDFFAHQEEIDLCWRIKNCGYSIKAFGTSEVFHLGGATLAKANPKKTFYNFRNTLFALVKNVSAPKFIFLIIARLFLDGIAGVKFLFEGKFKHCLAIINAHFSFYRYFRKFLGKRRLLKQTNEYCHTNSIIKDYYLKGKKTFSSLG